MIKNNYHLYCSCEESKKKRLVNYQNLAVILACEDCIVRFKL